MGWDGRTGTEYIHTQHVVIAQVAETRLPTVSIDDLALPCLRPPWSIHLSVSIAHARITIHFLASCVTIYLGTISQIPSGKRRPCRAWGLIDITRYTKR